MGYKGISFHAVVVFGLGKNLLFKSMLGRCDKKEKKKHQWIFTYTASKYPILIANTYIVHIHD